MENRAQQPKQGDLHWRLSSHPITLLFFLGFRISSLLIYLFGLWLFTSSFVLVFIVTMLLLAADFYYLKNIAGRRLVGLRWWNEVNTATGDSHWVFESQDRSGDGGGPVQNATDKRYVEIVGEDMRRETGIWGLLLGMWAGRFRGSRANAWVV
ncbi:Golgi apparatus membrane protein tvp23 [Imshaugia aleurites]|uniref:Golgi apparatus membrane protein TVP23 n=1 Tax=Imshaugia aleurites TaxID=172621 RepID=A0A8H3EUF0_9LECA|nr:Golgi apparatus membrane protein tvp23 [Imshaugia aleurites]